MGLNAGIYAQLTDTELTELEQGAYRAVRALYESASVIFDKLAKMTIRDGRYDGMQRTAAVQMSAAREQDQLHAEICEEAGARRRAAAAERDLQSRIRGALADPGAMTLAEMREYDANWTAQ